MLRTVRGFLFLAAITLIIAQFSSLQGQQRRQRPPADIPTGLDSLGIWQPESVRAILLLYSGKSISKPKAQELETDLLKTPEKIDSRLVLIGYYSSNGKTAADRLRLREHVLWMVGNHPEHPATGEPGLRDLPGDFEGNSQILALWNKNLESRSDELAVLKDAEKF